MELFYNLFSGQNAFCDRDKKVAVLYRK